MESLAKQTTLSIKEPCRRYMIQGDFVDDSQEPLAAGWQGKSLLIIPCWCKLVNINCLDLYCDAVFNKHNCGFPCFFPRPILWWGEKWYQQNPHPSQYTSFALFRFRKLQLRSFQNGDSRPLAGFAFTLLGPTVDGKNSAPPYAHRTHWKCSGKHYLLPGAGSFNNIIYSIIMHYQLTVPLQQSKEIKRNQLQDTSNLDYVDKSRLQFKRRTFQPFKSWQLQGLDNLRTELISSLQHSSSHSMYNTLLQHFSWATSHEPKREKLKAPQAFLVIMADLQTCYVHRCSAV